MTPLRIGTRSSRLALWQAEHVAALLGPARPVELVHIQTQGDRDSAASLAQIGGQGVFTKEIQRALLDRRVDVAVHSLKDLPTEPSPGLVIGAVPPRGPTGDALVSRNGVRFAELPPRARIATGSVRRRAMLLNRQPDLHPVDIRGNVDSRLRKLETDELDALVLAEAGLVRLGLESVITELFDQTWMLPAVGQGALGLECRAEDAETLALLAVLDDRATRAAVTAERALLFHLGGGCQVPLGALGMVTGEWLTLRGAVLALDGTRRIDGELAGAASEAAAIGERLAAHLRDRGAGELLTVSPRPERSEGSAM